MGIDEFEGVNLRDAIIKDVQYDLETDEITEKLENCEKSISSLKTDIKNEYLESEVKSLNKDVTNLKTDFGSMWSEITNLELKIEPSNSKKILTIVDEPSPATCKSCKNNPCLHFEYVIFENFMK